MNINMQAIDALPKIKTRTNAGNVKLSTHSQKDNQKVLRYDSLAKKYDSKIIWDDITSNKIIIRCLHCYFQYKQSKQNLYM